MQEPRGDEVTLQGLQFAEQMVDGRRKCEDLLEDVGPAGRADDPEH